MISSIIRKVTGRHPLYPSWVGDVVNDGQAQIMDTQRVETWFNEGHSFLSPCGSTGKDLLYHLQEHPKEWERNLGYQDGIWLAEHTQFLDRSEFLERWGDCAYLALWGTVVRHRRQKNLWVACLVRNQNGKGWHTSWTPVVRDCSNYSPGLRFKD